MTDWQVVLHPAAVEEAEAATRWYRERSSRAAAKFVEQMVEKSWVAFATDGAI